MKYLLYTTGCLLIYSSCYRTEPTLTVPTEKTLINLVAVVDSVKKTGLASEKTLNRIMETVQAFEVSLPGQYDSLLAEACHNIGRVVSNHPELARPFFSEALRLRKRFYHDDFSQRDILRSYCMVGVSYTKSEGLDPRKALSYLVDSARLCPWNTTTAVPHIFALSEAAQVYLVNKELIPAKACFQAARDSNHVYGNKTPNSILSEFYKSYISCARQLNDYQLALQLFKEGIAIYPDDMMKVADFEMLAGNIWQDSMRYCSQPALLAEARNNALLHMARAFSLYKSVGTFEAKNRAVMTMGNLGSMYYRSKQYELSRELLYDTLTDTSFAEQLAHVFAPVHINLGEALCALGKLEAGISHYQEAIKCLTPTGEKGQLTDFMIEDWPDLLYTYGNIAKAELLRYDSLKQPEILPRVIVAYESLRQLTNLTRNELLTEQSKFDLTEKSQEALSNAVGVCAQLYQITSNEEYKANAFSFAEQSKGFSLLEAVRLRQLGAANPNQKQRQQSALNEIPIAEFQQKLLSPDQGLVSYYTQDTVLNIFLIKPDTLIWERSTLQQDSIRDWAHKFQYLVQDPDQSTIRDPAKEKAIGTLGHTLYKTLLAPIKASLPPRLVIVAAAPFLGLPFENFSEQPFLGSLEKQVQEKNLVLFQHCISYDVSANIWAEMQNAKRSAALSNKVAAFAPSFNLSADPSELAGILAPMTNTKFELEGIGLRVPVSPFLDDDATKSTFEKAAKRFNIIHLASHSICDDANPDRSLLAFNQPGPTVDTGQLLYLRELYGLDLQQDLIVLSACETARGEFALGEGNLSIARGLAYAGAHSFVSTLWVINTEPGITIMPAFYKKLKAGSPKDVALAEAKREYLMDSPKNYAPLKWAGIVLNGSTKPIDFSDDACFPSWLWFLAAVVGLFGLLLFRKRNQRK